MFGEHTMNIGWRRPGELASRSPPNTARIPNTAFSYGDHFSPATMTSTPRYNVAPYPNGSVSPAGPNTGAGNTSITSQHAWPMGDHQMQFSNPHPTFCDSTQPSSAYYNESAASHLVGYPESSQRTLLQESAYGAAYSSSFPSAVSFGEPSTVSGAVSVDSQYGIYGIPTGASDRQHGHSQQQEYDAERNSTFGTNNQYLNAHADFEQTGATHRILPQLSPTLFSGLSAATGHSAPLYPMAYASSTSTTSSSAPSTHSEPSSALLDTHSSRLPAPFTQPLRRHSMDSVHSVQRDPMSPSSVPALVYDGDTGDDYDDDSESDPPSAVSELTRLPYPSMRATDISVHGNWSRSSFDTGYGGTASAHALHKSTTHHLRSPGRSADSGSTAAVSPSTASSSERPKPSQKKSKMHQCKVCHKLFPRPSGLATHMNSHSGAKPYKCPIPTCTKSFAVRSNAKRHLRTHGIFPTSDHNSSSQSQFTVGFDTPMVSDVHEVGKLPSKLRWIPQSLSTRTNAEYLRDAPSDSEEEYLRPSCPMLPVPLPAVRPSSPTWPPDDNYEERDSFADAETSPYLPSQWRGGLPGPAIVSSSSI